MRNSAYSLLETNRDNTQIVHCSTEVKEIWRMAKKTLSRKVGEQSIVSPEIIEEVERNTTILFDNMQARISHLEG